MEGQGNGYDGYSIGNAVAAALEDAGNMHSTIGQIRKSIKWLVVLAEKQDGIYTIWAECGIRLHDDQPAHREIEPQRHNDYNRLVWLFDSFVLTGVADVSAPPSRKQRKQPDSAELSGLPASWSHDLEQRGLAQSTQNGFGLMACDYLNFLETGGVFSWDDADGASLLRFR